MEITRLEASAMEDSLAELADLLVDAVEDGASVGFLLPLTRGLLDGDGTITNAVWRADTSRRSDYYYEWLRTRFVSASRAHLEWLRARLKASLELRGWIVTERRENRPNLYFALGYGKHDSIRLLSALYADPTAPCLLRKRHIWEKYERGHDL